MNAMKAIGLTALMFFTVFFTSCGEGKRNVEFNELPAALQVLISQNFDDEKMVYAISERENMGRKYEIVLSEGTEIEADGRGNWYEIKCRFKDVPASVVPTDIQQYVTAKHPESGIRKIEKKKKGYEIELENGLEIKFNNKFIVTEYDS